MIHYKKRGDWDLVNIGEMMNKAIMDGMLQAIIIFMPYIIPFLTTALVVWVIKKIIEKSHIIFQTYQETLEEWQGKKHERWAT